MTGIPYGPSGVMFGLREAHDLEEYGDCRLCSPLPAQWGAWQRGCPTTGLDAAPLWRPLPVQGSGAADPVERARRAVAELQAHRAGEDRAAAEVARAEQLARWHADDQAGGLQQRDHAADQGALSAGDGGAP